MHVKQIGRDLRRKLFGRFRRSRTSRSRSRSGSPSYRRDYCDHRDFRDRNRDRERDLHVVIGEVVESDMLTGMLCTKTEVDGVMVVPSILGAQLEREVRKGGLGLSNGTEKGRSIRDLGHLLQCMFLIHVMG